MTKVRIGLLGCGGVGSALCRLVTEKGDLFRVRDDLEFEIARIGVADPRRTRPQGVPLDRIVQGWTAVVSAGDVDVVVEAMGDPEQSGAAAMEALGRGLPVATASRRLVATHGAALAKLASSKRCGFGFEAALGGAVPVATTLMETLPANRFESVIGIASGTANFILSRMTEDGLSYAQALDKARERGLGRAECGAAIEEGKDAAWTLSALAALAFGVAVPAEEIHSEGIASVTPEDIRLVATFGYVVKPLAIARRTANGLELRVHPALVPMRHPLAAVRDEFTALYVEGDVTGESMLYGRGAGPTATAGALLGDVARLVRGRGTAFSERRWSYGTLEHIPIGEVVTGYHMFFPVVDKPGVIGRIASTLGTYGINIESAHAHLPDPEGARGLVQIISQKARERDVRAALRAVRELPVLTGDAWFYRIEG